MTQMLREETDTFLKTLYIAALGNAGDASALPYMMEYITTNQDRDLRLMAIKSVRLMPRGDHHRLPLMGVALRNWTRLEAGL